MRSSARPRYRRQLVVGQSGRCMAAYVYASCGVWESTTDVVFGGHCLIAENGTLLAESRSLPARRRSVDGRRGPRPSPCRPSAHQQLRRRPALTLLTVAHFERISFHLGASELGLPTDLRRRVDAHPFVPKEGEQLRERCEEIFQTQVAGLAKRLDHIGKPTAAIGVSGGLDSTLALLVACKTMDALAVPRQRILAFTMPGFGTSNRTRDNARASDASPRRHGPRSGHSAAVPGRNESAGPSAVRHSPGRPDGRGVYRSACIACRPTPASELVFENVQARMRTSLLMNSGFVIGTGDVSEAALGWCTYNGDHMSMYNPNSSIPKTLVKFLVDWAARNEFEGEARRTLLDIVDTLISPELLPLGADGQARQATEIAIGPYELHDFFLFHFLRYGAPPEKILFLAEHAPLRPLVHAGRTAPLAWRISAPILRQPVQAFLSS